MWRISCCFVCASLGQLHALVSFLCLSTCNVITANTLSANTGSDRFQNLGSVCSRKVNLVVLPEVPKTVGASCMFCLEVLTRGSAGLWPRGADTHLPVGARAAAACCSPQRAGTGAAGVAGAPGTGEGSEPRGPPGRQRRAGGGGPLP